MSAIPDRKPLDDRTIDVRTHQADRDGDPTAIGWRVVIVTALTAVRAAGRRSLRARPRQAAGGHRGKPPVGLPTPPPVPAGQLDQDLSGKLPVVNIDETPGDYLGEGHDQVADTQPGVLRIYESRKYGSDVPPKVITPTDLRTTPNDGFTGSEQVLPWDSSSPETQQRYESMGADWFLTRVQVAASASNIYLAGATWDDNALDPTNNGYQLHLYKLPHDGSCATAGCADKTVDLPSKAPPSARSARPSASSWRRRWRWVWSVDAR